jgi:hypothetical protein
MKIRLNDRYRAFITQTSSIKYLLIAGLLAVSAITNILLVLKVKELRVTISALKMEQGTVLGMQLPPLTAEDLSGQSVTVRFDESERPTLLYVFTPACGWCKRNEDNLRSLASQTSERLTIIGVSLSHDGLAEYVGQRFPPVRVIKPDARTITAYKLSGTPTTILVSSQGVVLRVWKGAYNDSLQRELEEYFHIKLPGLREFSSQL